MNNLVDNLKILNEISNAKYDDDNIKSDILEMIDNVNFMIDYFQDYVIEICVTPMAIIDNPMSKIDKLTFYITYNQEYIEGYTEEEVLDIQESFKSNLLESLEYLGDCVTNADFNFATTIVSNEPCIHLYSCFNKEYISRVSTEDKDLFLALILAGYDVICPYSYAFANHRSFIILVEDLKSFLDLISDDNDFYKSRIVLYRREDENDTRSVVLPIISKSFASYGLPYEAVSLENLRV